MNTSTLRRSLCALTFFSLAARAEPTAEVTFVYGQVVIVSGGNPKPISTGTIFHHGEVLRTGPKSTAIITLNEGSKVKLNENSVLLASQLDEGAAAGGNVDIELQAGSAFAKVQKRKENKFRIHTKSATMGVRGTEFFAGVSAPDDKGDLWMCVREGSVEVTDNATEQSVLVPAGKGVSKPAGKPITDARSYAWTKKLNWNMNPGNGTVFNKVPMDSVYLDLLKRDYD